MAPDARQRWPLELLARGGYAARGVVYLIVGALAVLAAVGSGGQTTDTRGALATLLDEPFGQVLLGLAALGLISYAVWRVLQAVTDPDRHGTDAKGLAVRGGMLVSAVSHTALAIFAASLIFGWGTGGGGEDESTQNWTAWLLQQPFGRWLVGAVGLAVIGAGLALIYRGWTAEFEKYLVMDRDTMARVRPVCRFGLMARGVVFLIVGGFLVVAAVRFASEEARGLAGALDALREQPYGWLLLAVVALGLVAFGIYSMIEAAYRRIEPPRTPRLA